ncbi:MAG: energy transducer TonB [Xanthomonadales bacterium]|nr:energy transducer TonB [Xanthomonadales bacterium]
MATHALQRKLKPDWNWLRISGLSGSFGLHVAALVLLALPVAIPVWKPAPPVITIDIRDAIPELPVSEVPPEPQPQTIVRRHEQPVPAQRPIVSADSVMAVPVATPITEVAETASATDIIAATPTVASNASLAYESIIEPRYPMESRRRGEQGTVLLRVLVGRDGQPIDIEVARSSGYRLLDRAAREAVLRWRFRPVQINGVNVVARGLVPVKFDVNQG